MIEANALPRRGLFDFVPPFVVYFAVVSYFLFAVYAIWLDLYVYDNASLSRHCLTAIGTVTLAYALNAFVIYKYLHGRKNPLETHEGVVHSIRVTVRAGVYTSIAIAWVFSIFGTLGQQGLQEWKPFALNAFLVVTTLLTFMSVTAPTRKPASSEPGSTEDPS